MAIFIAFLAAHSVSSNINSASSVAKVRMPPLFIDLFTHLDYHKTPTPLIPGSQFCHDTFCWVLFYFVVLFKLTFCGERDYLMMWKFCFRVVLKNFS
jgi:hypothetical protein